MVGKGRWQEILPQLPWCLQLAAEDDRRIGHETGPGWATTTQRSSLDGHCLVRGEDRDIYTCVHQYVLLFPYCKHAGPQGLPGSGGVPGNPGRQGRTGPHGSPGSPGSSGAKGAEGATGLTGNFRVEFLI